MILMGENKPTKKEIEEFGYGLFAVGLTVELIDLVEVICGKKLPPEEKKIVFLKVIKMIEDVKRKQKQKNKHLSSEDLK